MSSPLTPAEQARYTAIIDKILATADLNTVTRKKIRLGLEKALDGKDLSEQKDAIKRLIEARFDAISGDDPIETPSVPTAKRQSNGHPATTTTPSSPPASPEGEIKVSTAALDPPRKKQKRETSLDADAKLAAELQAQENRLATARTTRGGGVVKKKTKKAAPKKKKSEKRVRGSDESGAEDGSGAEAPKRKAAGGFMKPFNLSEHLAELCGETQVVKKLWEHIKGNDLQDPKDKRQILCDEKMAAIFKQTKVDMFQMNKIIGSHLYPVEEEV